MMGLDEFDRETKFGADSDRHRRIADTRVAAGGERSGSDEGHKGDSKASWRMIARAR